MTELTYLAGFFAAGAALGAVFFWSLWRSTRQLTQPNPMSRLLGHLLLRFGLTLGVLYLVARTGGWTGLLAAAAGFTAARFFAVRRTLRGATDDGSHP